MLKRLQEQKDVLELISSKTEVIIAAKLKSEDWKTLKCAVEILEMFKTATLQVSKEPSCISEVGFFSFF